jgi:aromatic ring hydroxylase
LTLSGAVPVSLSAYARITPIRANIGGPSCSATSNSTSIAACHSSASCSCLGQFGDVFCGLAEIGLRECGAQVSKIVDDEIKGLIVTARQSKSGRADQRN